MNDKSLAMVDKMTDLVKAARDLVFFRGVAGEFEPLEVEYAPQSDYHELRNDYRDWVDQRWNHPDTWFVESIPDIFKRSDYGELELELGGYWDNWDGEPTEMITTNDITRLREEYDVSVVEYSRYFDLKPDEKETARDECLEKRYQPLLALLENRE